MTEFRLADKILTLSRSSEIVVQKCDVEQNMLFHAHNFIEIVYVCSGSGRHEIGDGSSFAVEQGDLMLFNSNVPHVFEVGGSGLVVYNCLFDPSVLRFAINKSDDFINIVYSCLFEGTPGSTENVAGEPGSVVGNGEGMVGKADNIAGKADDNAGKADDIAGNDEGMAGRTAPKRSVSKPYMILKGADRIFPIIYEMYTEYTAKTSGYEKINEANLVRLLVSIFRLQMRGEERGDSAFRRAIAESAILYMKEYCHEKITCEMLASRAYLSTGYFHRIFKAVTGESPIDYLQNIRLEKAAAILSSSRATVKEAAADVGYQDMKHFYRIFHKKYGVTPKQYRKQAGN